MPKAVGIEEVITNSKGHGKQGQCPRNDQARKNKTRAPRARGACSKADSPYWILHQQKAVDLGRFEVDGFEVPKRHTSYNAPPHLAAISQSGAKYALKAHACSRRGRQDGDGAWRRDRRTQPWEQQHCEPGPSQHEPSRSGATCWPRQPNAGPCPRPGHRSHGLDQKRRAGHHSTCESCWPDRDRQKQDARQLRGQPPSTLQCAAEAHDSQRHRPRQHGREQQRRGR